MPLVLICPGPARGNAAGKSTCVCGSAAAAAANAATAATAAAGFTCISKDDPAAQRCFKMLHHL